MQQLAWKLDDITQSKIWKSAQIALGGYVLLAVPYLSEELISYLSSGNPIDWKNLLIMFIGASSTWVVASVREWVKGK